MPKRILMPNMYARQYVTRAGYKRTLWYARFSDETGKRLKPIPLGDDFEYAKAERDRLAVRVAQGEDPTAKQKPARPATFRAWAQYWLDLTTTKRSHDKDEMSVTRLRAFFGDEDLRYWKPSRIEAYKVLRFSELTRRGTPPAPGTINRELACLRSILLLAFYDHVVRDKPIVKMLEEDNERDRVPSVEEYHTLLKKLPPPLPAILILLWELGMRETEAITLQRAAVDFQKETIWLEKTKRKKRRIPMTPLVIATLKAVPDKDPVFFFPEVTRQGFYARFARLCEKEGFDDLWPHDFRRGFITRKEEEGWPPKMIMLMTGLSTLKAYQRYNQPSFANLQERVRASQNPTYTMPTHSPSSPPHQPNSAVNSPDLQE